MCAVFAAVNVNNISLRRGEYRGYFGHGASGIVDSDGKVNLKLPGGFIGPLHAHKPFAVFVQEFFSNRAVGRMNGKPFALTGFGWDLGGYTNGWDGGRLEKPVGGCNLSLRFDPASDAPGDALDKVTGDVEFLSTDSAMRQTRPVVIEIELGWPL